MKNVKFCLSVISLFILVSCNEEKKCDQEYVTSYQRMGDAFSELYSPKSGSFELNNLRNSIASFLEDHKDAVCTIDGESMDLTSEVQSFLDSLPKMSIEQTIVKPKVIYGGDDRINVSDASGFLQNLARSTAAQISPSKWDGNFKLVDETLGKRLSLCPGERFENEVSVSRCSGFLVGPDTLVTAGHCVQSEFECSEYRWVFDYKDNPSSIDPNQIYKCQSIVKQVLDNDTSLDYAVIKLDRLVEDRKFFRVRTSGTAAVGSSLVVIGHPSGLSTKIAANAQVRENSDDSFFVANLDVFGGNSGSAVLAANSSTVEGILVRGEEDYITIDGPDGSRCQVVNQCSNTNCNGEEVTKMSSVEGIELIDNFSMIQKGLFLSKNFPEIEEGLPIGFRGYSFGRFTVGGLRFLDRCGVHFYENSDASAWIEFHVGACSETNAMKSVVAAFGDQFYF